MRRALIAGSIFAAAAASVGTSAVAPTARTVYVSVMDDKGQAVTGLTAADFSLKEGGKDREISSVEPAKAKMHLALMVEETLTPQGGVRLGLAEFIRRMFPIADIALVVVGQRNSTAVDFTADPDKLIAGINAFPLSVGQHTTSVPEGIFDMAKQFEQRKPTRPAMVLVALEKDQASAEEPQNVLNQIAKSGATLHAVTIDGGSSAAVGAGALQDLAGRAQVIGDGSKQSGGRRIEVSALTAFSRGLQQVADDLSSQYQITYMLPDGVKPSDRITVAIKKKGVTLRAPARVPDK